MSAISPKVAVGEVHRAPGTGRGGLRALDRGPGGDAPGEGAPWAGVVAGAIAVRERLVAAGLAGFLKTTGGHGLHVVVPLRPAAGWGAVKAFAKSVADAMAADDPGRFVATSTEAGRAGRIDLDDLRNGRGATAVAAYSTRARPGAPVAVPIGRDEAADLGSGAAFTVETLPRRLDHIAVDPWADMAAAARPLVGAKPAPKRR